MAMYTDFFLNVNLRESTPKGVFKMCKATPFYGKVTKVGLLKLAIHTGIKNNADQIDDFLCEIHPHVYCVHKTFVGFSIHESHEHPTLIFYYPERFRYSTIPPEMETVQEIRNKMYKVEEINRNLNLVNDALKKKISNLVHEVAEYTGARFPEGKMVENYECPVCGSAEHTGKGLMQGGVNCTCVCGAKYHVCAF